MFQGIDSPTEHIPDPEVYRRQRSYTDLYTRALVGPVYYVIACLLLLATGTLSGLLSIVMAAMIVMFLVNWRVRHANRLPQDFSDVAACRRWSRREWATVHGAYLLWSLTTALVAIDQRELNLSVFIATVALAAFGSAGGTVFSVNGRQQKITLAILHWPAIVVLVFFPDVRMLGLFLLIIWFSCSRSAQNMAREYDAQIALEHALMVSRAEVQALARTDALTGLANRHEYVSRFNWAWTGAQRNKTALALAVIDLDHFKAVNDLHGHLAGDACLKHVAGLLRHHFRRADDFVARIGGEEFVAVLPSTSVEVAHRMCEEFRLALAASATVYEGRSIAVTASIGVGAVALASDIKPDANFARIDAATFQAKAQGRNQTVIAADAPALKPPVEA